MRVAVVTAYWQDDANFIERCVASVGYQDISATHIIVADGCDMPVRDSFFKDVQQVQSLIRHNDYGDTPRYLGCKTAIDDGYEAVAFLDADNWYHRGHLSSLISLHCSTGALVCASQRMICAADGAPLGVCLASGTKYFCDTSCLMLFGKGMLLGGQWGKIPSEFHAIGDRILWKYISDLRIARSFSLLPTVAYTANHQKFYERAGMPAPEDAQKESGIRAAVNRYRIRHGIDLSVQWELTPWKDLDPSERTWWEAGAR